ncbi:MAG: 16S rRNA (cytosine(967)-C(5))-methyltransferase RsmB, partial [Clostridiales bacterium]|nr:16S rRNA (cytosine(967)-C(5))-methyltransferase RsmB [Clostridiales bacterium]
AKRGTPGAKSLVNAVLRSVAKEADILRAELESAKPYVRFSLSREIAGLLIKWYGISKAESIASALLGEAKVTARANALRCTRAELKDRLETEGVQSDPGRFSDRSLTLHLNGIPIDSLRAYQDGLFMIQDEAAMMVGILARPRPGQRILDVCAAPGGKSCHMAELSTDDADILALDIHESRLKLIEENAQRLGIKSVRTAISDASDPDRTVVGAPGSYDIVLADVPCSGLGLMKRKPDIRLTSSYDRIMSLLDVQEQILDQSANFVKPGGVLMYSTCTINPDENENRIETFLDRHAQFVPEPLTGDLPVALMSLPRHVREGELGRLLLLPDDDDCDGFFISKMRRVS